MTAVSSRRATGPALGTSDSIGLGAGSRRAVVLAAGASTMALQMCASRLLQPWVGGSSYMWATVIGLSLLAMSCGYLLGGRLVDRQPHGRLLGRLLVQAAGAVAIAPIFAPLLLPYSTLGIDHVVWSVLVGSAVGYLLLIAPAAVLLGMVPPFVIRLALDDVAHAGRTAGSLYALSTVGSIVGTLGSVLVLVQWIGTRATLVTIVVVLLAAGALALMRGGGTGRVLVRQRLRQITEIDDRGDAIATVPDSCDLTEVARHHGTTPVGVLSLSTATVIVVVEGIATMAGEMGAARLIAPFYGASTIVWANLIALVLLAISLGSWLGGRLADRRPTVSTLAVLVTSGGLATALLPFVAGPIMRLSTGGIDAVDVGTVVGSFFASVALLIVPMTLLGMVPPFVIRLAMPDVEHAGGAAGRLYAASTAGALIGTFGSALVLIPTIGTRRTLLLVGALPVLMATWLALRDRAARIGPVPSVAVPVGAAAVVMVLALLPVGYVKPLDASKVIFEGESRYQFVQVVEDRSGRRLLQLNEGWAVHSIYDPDTVLTGGIWDHFLVLPAMLERTERDADSTRQRDFLIVGNAAGTAARAYHQLRPNVDVTGVELDPVVTEVGREHFAMDEADPEIVAADGRPFLARTGGHWHVIHIDAYRQPYIPFYLTTREFFEVVRDRLEPGGIVSINVGSTPEDDTINRHVAATMRDVFPLVARYRAEEYNEVIIGVSEQGVTLDELRERIRSSDLARGDSPLFDDGKFEAERPELARLFEDFAAGMVQTRPDDELVLTDDRAPVEWMTDRMIFGAADSQ